MVLPSAESRVVVGGFAASVAALRRPIVELVLATVVVLVAAQVVAHGTLRAASLVAFIHAARQLLITNPTHKPVRQPNVYLLTLGKRLSSATLFLRWMAEGA